MDIVKVESADPMQLEDSELSSFSSGQLLVAFNELKDQWAKLSGDVEKKMDSLQQQADGWRTDIAAVEEKMAELEQQLARRDIKSAQKAELRRQLAEEKEKKLRLEAQAEEALAKRDKLSADVFEQTQSIDVSCYVPTVFEDEYVVKVQDFQPPKSAAPELSAALASSVVEVVKKLRDATKSAKQG